jgi:6-phosphogluconolactonase (cycloisomerase 2 family)
MLNKYSDFQHTQDGRLSLLAVAAVHNPSFVCTSETVQDVLYAVSELDDFDVNKCGGGGREGGLSAYRIDADTGGLHFLNSMATGGADPCFVAVSRRPPRQTQNFNILGSEMFSSPIYTNTMFFVFINKM